MADAQRHFPLKLTQAQRKRVAEIAPELSDRLKLDEKTQRTIPFTRAELKAIKRQMVFCFAAHCLSRCIRHELSSFYGMEAWAVMRHDHLPPNPLRHYFVLGTSGAVTRQKSFLVFAKQPLS